MPENDPCVSKWYVSESTVNVFLKKTQKEPPVFLKEVVDREMG